LKALEDESLNKLDDIIKYTDEFVKGVLKGLIAIADVGTSAMERLPDITKRANIYGQMRISWKSLNTFSELLGKNLLLHGGEKVLSSRHPNPSSNPNPNPKALQTLSLRANCRPLP
jgi:hypothetical protein